MQCANCLKTFSPKAKGFKRASLVSKKREHGLVEDALDISLTPSTAKKGYFLCICCEKLVERVTVGHSAKKDLFATTSSDSYIGRKRATQIPAKKRKASTQNKNKKTNPGLKYLAQSHYKLGFRYFLKKQAARRALASLLVKDTRRLVRRVIKDKMLPFTAKVSVDAFRKMSLKHTVDVFKQEVPFLHDILVAAFTALTGRGYEARLPEKHQAALGFVLSIVASRASPLSSSLVQKMNAVQMWRAGCKRTLLQDFNHLGICCGEKGMMTTLDIIKNSFDVELIQWKVELERYVYPGITDMNESAFNSADELPSDDLPSGDLTSVPDVDEQWVDVEEKDNTYESLDELDESEDALDQTICYAKDDIPPGYTLCWDNVGRQVKARHQTRNHGNVYQTWALAYAVKNRISTSHLDSTHVKSATSIPVDTFILNNIEHKQIHERLVNMTARIIKKHVRSARDTDVMEHFEHYFAEQSRRKSEMFNIGVLEENPSTISGVVNILDHLHNYVPTDGGNVHTIVTWGDGLSCERHADAQNARANAETPRDRLEGLEPAAQEFHKRMILLQDVMDNYYDGRSATDKGTLFHLRNVLNHRSVTKKVSESFNYVSEFIQFVTEAYIIAFALDKLGRDDMDSDGTTTTAELMSIACEIVDTIWSPIELTDLEENDEYCFCKQSIDDDETPMIECDGQDCSNGKWFHFECVGLEEDTVPEGSWYCSAECRSKLSSYCYCKRQIPDQPMVECCHSLCANGRWFHAKCIGLTEDTLPGEDEIWFCSQTCKESETTRTCPDANDLKFEYTKRVVWAGLSDLVRRDAVRHNDGPMMTTYWKADLLQFQAYNHPKYFILGHRLIASVNGWLPERLRNDLIWNRTVNMRGERDSNDEADLVNEFLNREFKESLRGIGGKATSDTLARHGKLAGGVGKTIQQMYSSMSQGRGEHIGKRAETRRDEDLRYIVGLLLREQLIKVVGKRFHKAFPTLKKKSCSRTKYTCRVQVLSDRLERRRRIVV